MIENRIKKTTRRMYAGYIRKFREWAEDNQLNVVDDEDKVKVPVDTEILLQFFSFLANGGIHTNVNGLLLDAENNVVTREDEGKRTKATTTMGAVRSAFKDYYKMHLIRMPEEQEVRLTSFLAGFKRNVAQLKLEGYMEIREGRSPVSFPGYHALAMSILRGCPESRSSSWLQHIMPWPFHLLCWNLIGRSCSVGNLMLQHLRWKNDCLTIVLPKHKGDQCGDMVFDRHIYANPMQPAICSILALAVYIFCKPFRNPADRALLFDGTRCEKQFSDLLSAVINNLPEGDKILLGARPEDIGTHSNRKGASTYALSVIGGPSPVTVFIRAGWSIGDVKDRYIHSGDGNDQLAGRVLAGLPITDSNFGSLPPHFRSLDLEFSWNELLPGYENYPESFQTCLPFLLASIVYHEDWLKRNLHHNHPIFLQRIFSGGYVSRLKALVVTGSGTDPDCGMVATGIPHHILLAERLRAVEDKMDVVLKRKLEDLSDHLDDQLEQLPSKLSSKLRSEFVIEGTVAVTRHDVVEVVESLRLDLISRFSSHINPNQHTIPSQENTPEPEFLTFTWGGRLHPVPEGFRFPTTVDVKTLWELWWYGDKPKRIRPFRHIKSFDLTESRDNSAFCKAKKVIHSLESIGRRQGVFSGNSLSDMNKIENDRGFSHSYVRLLEFIGRGRQPAEGELSYITVYDLLQKKSRNA
jgi:hypothetical protein